MRELAIEVQNLVKRYGDTVAVNGLSFTVHRGEIFGLLGPNGAGKTTTLECLEGLRCPDSGHLRVMGVDPNKEHRRLLEIIGVQLQTGALPNHLSVKEMVQLFSAYRGIKPDFGILERLGLQDKLTSQYHALSTGQKRRLALALAIGHQPAVLFLDEPTAGLDVTTRISLHELMQELRDNGTTIVLSTHDMAEAESMADRVAVLLRGQLAAIGTPRELTASGAGLTKISVRTVKNSLAAASIPHTVRQAWQDEYAVFFTRQPGPAVTAIIAHIENHNDELVDLRVERPSLEERFLELTQDSLVSPFQ